MEKDIVPLTDESVVVPAVVVPIPVETDESMRSEFFLDPYSGTLGAIELLRKYPP